MNYKNNTMLLELILTILLVMCNGFFVAAEFAIVKVRSSQVELKIRSGSRAAKVAKLIITHMDEYLSATQLGVTLASLGLGWVGESVVAGIIHNIMMALGIPFTYQTAHTVALPVAFITITIMHIVFGELAPKSLAIQKASDIVLGIAFPLRIFYLIFRPFIWLLNTLANKMIGLLGIETLSEEEDSTHSPEELRYLLEESSKKGIIKTSDHEMLENIFDFAQTPVKQIMIPRGKIAGIESGLNREEVINRFIDEGYSRMPVYENTIDNIVGVIYSKNLIDVLSHPDLILIEDITRPAYFVSEDEMIDKLLINMKKNKIHIAFVLDEFGGTSGLVTLEDIIEEIFGEIQDEDDEEKPIVEVKNNIYVVQASAPVSDANDYLPFAIPEDDNYETVGGYVINELGRIPVNGEEINLEHYKCKIISSSNIHIETLQLTVMKDTFKSEY